MVMLTMLACLIRQDVYEERKALLADEDADGWTVLSGDCADGAPDVHPDAEEQCNGVDDDCDLAVDEGVELTVWYADTDGDGFGAGVGVPACLAPESYVANAADCGSEDPAVSPTAGEVPYDGVDQDCDGSDLDDLDGDGDAAEAAGGGDCEDTDASRSSLATETWSNDRIDNDCDGDALEDVAWDITTVTTRFDGPGAGAELGRGVAVAGDCLLLDAPYVEENRGAVFAERGAGVRTVGGGGLVEGSAPYAYLSTKDVGTDLIVMGEPVLAAGRAWLVSSETLCSGALDLESDAQSIAGVELDDFFGADATWVGDIDGDGAEELAVAAIGSGEEEGAISIFSGAGLHSVSSAQDADWTVRGGAVGVSLSAVARADGREASWLVFAGTPTVDDDAAIRRVSVDGLQTGDVDDLADGWVTGIGTLRPIVVGDMSVDGSDDLVLAGAASALWDIADIEGSVSEGEGEVYLRAEGDEWLTNVTPLGDIDGGGRADVLLQADDFPLGEARGRVAFLFGEDLLPGAVNYFERQRLTAYGGSVGDAFGYRAAAVGDFDGDGASDVAIGAYGADSNGASAGSVYLVPFP